MGRWAILLYGIGNYLLFLGVGAYFAGFLVDAGVPRSIDQGPAGPPGLAVLVDLGLILLFGLQHSIMASRGFKRRWTQFIPPAIERSTYMLATNIVFVLMFVFWRPIPQAIWQIEHPVASMAVQLACATGGLIAVYATFLTHHFDLFGLRQVYLHWRGHPYSPAPFRERSLYRRVRHPMMLGLLIALWATPSMTIGHLLFSLGMSIYIAVGIRFEEAALLKELGTAYAAYQRRTSRVLPF